MAVLLSGVVVAGEREAVRVTDRLDQHTAPAGDNALRVQPVFDLLGEPDRAGGE